MKSGRYDKNSDSHVNVFETTLYSPGGGGQGIVCTGYGPAWYPPGANPGAGGMGCGIGCGALSGYGTWPCDMVTVVFGTPPTDTLTKGYKVVVQDFIDTLRVNITLYLTP